MRDHEDGLAIAPQQSHRRAGRQRLARLRAERPVARHRRQCADLCRTHIIPALGARKLRELSATDVDRWLAREGEDAEHEHAAGAASVPQPGGQPGDGARPGQAQRRGAVLGPEGSGGPAVEVADPRPGEGAARRGRGRTDARVHRRLAADRGADRGATGAAPGSTSTWTARPDAEPPVPPSMQVWRSVREGGDTKTRKSRRTLALPRRCVEALRAHRASRTRHAVGRVAGEHRPGVRRRRSGPSWTRPTSVESFRRVIKAAGLDPATWTPRELRHSFVSLLSDGGVSIEDIADLVRPRRARR